MLEATRADVLAYRLGRHQLARDDRALDGASAVDLLDYGIQDTGVDGASWSLALRGAPPAEDDELLQAWTIRGAPHVYRRAEVAGIVVATAPWSEADASSRIYDAGKPLREADIPVLDGLATVAAAMRDIVVEPTVKGEMSSRLAEQLPEPYLASAGSATRPTFTRWPSACRRCRPASS